MVEIERCAKCKGQVFSRVELEAGRTVRELFCIQCGYTGEPLPAPPIEDGHRPARGGSHMGPRL